MTTQSPVSTPEAEMCAIVDDADRPLRQGDIFVETAAPERPAGIVVTSDCDLANRKAWRLINYVPIVPLESYAASRCLHDEILRLVDASRESIRAAVTKFRAQQGLPPLSDDVIASWLGALNTDSLQLPFEDPHDHDAQRRRRAKFQNHVEGLAAAREIAKLLPARDAALPAALVSQMLAALKFLKTAHGGSCSTESLVKSLSQDIDQHPQDVFHLYGLPGASHEAHSALLRLVREIDHDRIALQAGPAIERDLPYFRVARLASPYRYDLTRRLGAVFSDIGLP